jgi:two-component system response regulator VanR
MPDKILIVDDSFEDSSLIKSILEKEGYSAFVATNGAQALDMMNSINFGLVLIDVKMPTLSGYDLLRLLREKYNGKTKMCYVTIVPRKDVDLTEVNGFVQKPFTKATLLEEVKKLMRK